MHSQPLEIAGLAKNVLGRGRQERERLEQLLAERRYEEALDLVSALRESAPEDDAILARCVTLLEERLLRRYLKAINPSSVARVVASPEHPAWAHLAPEERRVVEQVDGRTSFDEIAGSSGAGRFRTYRAMMHLIHAGIVGAAAPRPAIVDQTAVLPLSRVRARTVPPVARPARSRRALVALLGASAAIALAVVGIGRFAARHEAPAVVAPAAALVPAAPVVAAAPAVATAPAPVVAPAEAPPVVAPEPPPATAPVTVVEAIATVSAELAEKPAPVVERPRPAPRAPGVRIAVEGLSVHGNLTGAAVEQAVKRQYGALEQCHARNRRDVGEARAILVFAEGGRVQQAAVGRGINPGLRRCVRGVLLRTRASEDGRADFTLRFARR